MAQPRFEDDGYVCIAFILLGAACTAAQQDRFSCWVGLRDTLSEYSRGGQCVDREVSGNHVLVLLPR